MNRRNLTSFLVRHRNDVGDVEFTLCVVVVELRQPALHVRATGNQNTGVDLLNLALFVAGIFMLNNTRDVAVFTGDAAITAWIVQHDGQQTDTALRFGFTQASQGFNGDQRDIAVEHQNVFVIRKERRSLLHRMACAQLFGLKHPVELVIAQRLFKQIAAVAVDQVDLTGTQFVRCINDMLHHWLSCKRVEHLRQIGIHAGPFASGKDHHAHRTV